MGEQIAVGEFSSPIGRIRLAASGQGLVRIGLPRSANSFRGWLSQRLNGAESFESLPALDQAQQELSDYFDGNCREFKVPLDLRGTPFQRDVWDALLDIPYGETRSYAQIAQAIGRPRAVRAVGTANGANPLSLIVPCHRVIASDGGIGGYGGGLDTKQQLLAFEQARSCNGRLL